MAKYKVGKNKPPRKSQFKRGKSGNPRGRPKGSRNFTTVLSDELNQYISVRENGVNKRMSAKTALSKKLVAQGLAGDLRAIQTISAHERQAANQRQQPDMTIEISDVELLRKYFPYLQNILRRQGGNNDNDSQSD